MGIIIYFTNKTMRFALAIVALVASASAACGTGKGDFNASLDTKAKWDLFKSATLCRANSSAALLVTRNTRVAAWFAANAAANSSNSAMIAAKAEMTKRGNANTTAKGLNNTAQATARKLLTPLTTRPLSREF